MTDSVQPNTPSPSVLGDSNNKNNEKLESSSRPPHPVLRVMFYDSTILIGILFVVVMLVKIGNVDFYSLSNPEYMRGVLTIIIVLSFVVLGVILILGSLFGSRNGGKDESDERFRRAREIYAGIVGIVGTIIGFYFGSASTSAGDTLQVKKGIEGNFLTISVSGGSRPYTVTVTSDHEEKVIDSPDGIAKVDLCAFKPSEKTLYWVEVTDSRQVIKRIKFNKPVELKCPNVPLATLEKNS